MKSAFRPLRRMALWIPNTGPKHDLERGHLFVILTNPCPAGFCLLVPFSTAHDRCDRTCLVGAGDHPFLKHKSFAFYAQLNTYSADDLVARVASGRIEYQGLLDEKVFALASAGVLQSQHAPLKFQQYFEAQTAAN